ncbi:MAG TPA: radical SAM protein [Terriglobales bacterium]|nr:radical SAM protein [Terriglobales bacterium]
MAKTLQEIVRRRVEEQRALPLVDASAVKPWRHANDVPAARKDIVMVYPSQGLSGTYVRHAPISLLYASANLVKFGYHVEVQDNRLNPGDWRGELRARLTDRTLAVGVSVMSGTPIKNAVEISRFVKSVDPAIRIVWGGPHATFHPESILQFEASVDYVVSGYANEPFYHLVNAIVDGDPPAGVQGVSWRRGAEIVQNSYGDRAFEYIPHEEIPYHLIGDYTKYGQLDQDKLIFSMYSVHGCPYSCSFCSSPAQYSGIEGKKWIPFEAEAVVDHIQYVVEKYGATYIYFIDDDSFPKLSHVEGIVDEIRRRRLKVGLGFRGARINEIKRMSHEFLSKLAAAGTDILHIGAESGSNAMLQLIRKDCTVDDIIECNRKLAQHPEIMVGYNFIMGLPGETLEDLKKTRDLMLRLVEDNPRCIIFIPNRFRPLPKTELFDISARDWGYQPPRDLDEWANIEVEGSYSLPWHTPAITRFCNLLVIGAYFIDNKIEKTTEGKSLLYKVARLVNRVYGPVARWRVRNGYDRFLVEYWVYRMTTRIMTRIKTRSGRARAAFEPRAERENC